MVTFIYLFFCGLFTDDVSSLDYIVLKSRMISSDYIALNREQWIAENSKGMFTAAFEEPWLDGLKKTKKIIKSG
jgi:uncharacterized membrane protein